MTEPELCVCGHPVYRCPGGLVLEAGPEFIGPIDPATGRYITIAQARAGRIGKPTHQCTGPRDTQEALWA